MGKIFTLVCGLLLVAAVGLWGYGAFVVGAEYEKAERAVKKKKGDLKKRAGAAHLIKNKAYIEYENKRKAKLDEEETALRALMKSRQVKIDPAVAALPIAQFRIHVTKKYDEETKMLADRGIFMPPSPDARGHTFQWDEVTDADRQRILRNLVVTGEISKALAGAGSKVTYEVEGETKVEDRKIDELRSVKFTEKSTVSGVPGKTVESDKPYKEQKILLEINAHYNVLIEALRQMESSAECLFVVRSILIKRLQIYPSEIDDDKRAIYKDVPEHEIPVEAQVTLGLLEFPDKPVAPPSE